MNQKCRTAVAQFEVPCLVPKTVAVSAALAFLSLPSATAAASPTQAAGSEGVDVRGIVGTGAQGIVGTGVQGIVGTGAQGIVGTGVQGIVGTGAQGIVGTGAQGIVGTGVQGIVGTGAQGIVGTGVHGIVGTGVQGIVGTGVQGIVGTGVQGIVGTGVQGIVGTGVQGIVGTGVQGIVGTDRADTASIPIQTAEGHSVNGVFRTISGPVDSVDFSAKQVTVLGQRVELVSQAVLGELNDALSSQSGTVYVDVLGRLASAGRIMVSGITHVQSVYVPGATPVVITGSITSIHPGLARVKIGNSQVDVSAVTAQEFETLAVGDVVTVRGIQPVRYGVIVGDEIRRLIGNL